MTLHEGDLRFRWATPSRWKDVEAFERHAELPHTVRFLETAEPLIDNAFDIHRTEQIR